MFEQQIIAGRYRVIAKLATGGMGTTFRAWDKFSSKPVVIKVPNESCIADSTLIARFDREIELLFSFAHPQIVPILDKGHHKKIPYVVMRFLPGGSLGDRLGLTGPGGSRTHSPSMLHFWLPLIANALDFLHSKNVVHRDVKPSNIFFDGFWNPFLGDFGLAKNNGTNATTDGEIDLTATDTGLGTLAYTSPEQLMQSKSVDGRADQYSLAVAVFEFLSGKKPFQGKEAHVVIEIIQGNYSSLESLVPNLPKTIYTALTRAMDRSRERRYRTCKHFVTNLLEDVPKRLPEEDVARLLCPACKKIIKLRLSAAGTTALCPKCKVPMTAAADLSAFWLVSEDPTQYVAEELAYLPEAIQITQDDEELEEALPIKGNTEALPFVQLNDEGEDLDDLSWLTQHKNEKSTANVGDSVHANDDFELDTRHKPNSLSNRNRTVYLRKRRRRNSAPIILSFAIIFFAISCAILVSIVAPKFRKPDLGITISDFFKKSYGEIEFDKESGNVTFIFPENSDPDSDTILWITAQDPHGAVEFELRDNGELIQNDPVLDDFSYPVDGNLNGRSTSISWSGPGNVKWIYRLEKDGEKTLEIEGGHNVDDTGYVLRLQPSGN